MFRNFTNYEIYDDGRIWSYKKKRFLKPSTLQNGYQQVSLSDNEGKMKCYLLHRVIWESVTGEPIPSGFEINHLSEDKTDNRFANLNLLTHKDNMNFGTRTERATNANTNNPKRSKAVGAFKNNELVFTFPSTREAGRNGFNQGHIASCCRNCYMREGNNVYKGYTWKYI